MRIIALTAALVLSVATAGPAAAQLRPLTSGDFSNSYGDDKLSYQNGVVYDDDLVPGRGLNQPFLVDEQGGGSSRRSATGSAYVGAGEARRNSQQLIGPDGRLSSTSDSVRYTD